MFLITAFNKYEVFKESPIILILFFLSLLSIISLSENNISFNFFALLNKLKNCFLFNGNDFLIEFPFFSSSSILFFL